jgi:hypothetical protein
VGRRPKLAGNQPVVLSSNSLTNVQTGSLIQSNCSARFIGNNSVTGTNSNASVGVDIRDGSRVSVLGGSFTDSGIGIVVASGYRTKSR